MISQVLKLARLHGTDALLARERFELDEVIEEVVRDANFEGAVKNCQRSSATARRNNALLGSRELLRSAIENVLRNAVRYSPEDAPVEVQVGRAPSGGVEIVDSRSRTGRARGGFGAHLRALLPGGRIARPRQRRRGHRPRHHLASDEGSRRLGQGRQSPRGGLEVRLSLPEAAIAV